MKLFFGIVLVRCIVVIFFESCVVYEGGLLGSVDEDWRRIKKVSYVDTVYRTHDTTNPLEEGS